MKFTVAILALVFANFVFQGTDAGWAAVPAVASLALPILELIRDNIKHMGNSHATHLELFNDSDGELTIEVSEVDNHDWDGDSRPDHQFQDATIGAHQTIRHRQEINAKSKSAMSTMKFRFNGEEAFSMRIDQWAALSDKKEEKDFDLEDGWKVHMVAGADDSTLHYTFTQS